MQVQVPSVAYIQLFFLMMGLEKLETYIGERNKVRINCAPSWFYLEDLIYNLCNYRALSENITGSYHLVNFGVTGKFLAFTNIVNKTTRY
jgi:hypothetical protein